VSQTPDPDKDEALEGLQLDLATVVLRLRQLRHEQARLWQGNATVFNRLLTCDLPRLESHLTAATLAWLGRDDL
jgi:hypothetical protein